MNRRHRSRINALVALLMMLQVFLPNPASVPTASASPNTAPGGQQPPPPPDVSVALSHAGNFTAGLDGAYTVTVTNGAAAGPTTGPVSLTINLPNGITFVKSEGTGWSCSAVVLPLTCSNTTILAPGASSSLALTVAAHRAAIPSKTTTADVTTPGDSNAANNSASDLTTVDPYYTYDIVAQTGQLTQHGPLTALDQDVSINDAGTVAFIGMHDGGQGIYVAPVSQAPRSIAPGDFLSSRSYNPGVQINNRGQVVVRRLVAGIAGPPSVPPREFLQVYEGDGAPAPPIEITSGGQTVAPGNDPYEAIHSFASINNAATPRVAFSGTKFGATFLGTTTAPSTGINEFFAVIPLRPMIADNGNVAFALRSGANAPIFLHNFNHSSRLRIAGTAEGFTLQGIRPGISDTGAIVAFAASKDGGPRGVYASLADTGTTRRPPVLVTGGKWNGTSCAEAELGVDQAGNPMCFSSIEADERVGVVHLASRETVAGGDTFIITFTGTPNTFGPGAPPAFRPTKGIWSVRVDLDTDGNVVPSGHRPVMVAEVGDEIEGRIITDVGANDPVAAVPGGVPGAHRAALVAATGSSDAYVVRAARLAPAPPPPPPVGRCVNASLVSVDLNHQHISSQDWIAVPSDGTVDGNVVRIRTNVQGTVSSQETCELRFLDADFGTLLPSAVPSLPDGTVTQNLPAGQVTEIDYLWDTSGYAWNDSGQANSNRRIRVELREPGQPGVIGNIGKDVLVKPKPVILVHGWSSNHETWDEYTKAGGYLEQAHPLLKGFAVGDDGNPMRTGELFNLELLPPYITMNINATNLPNRISQNAVIMDDYIEDIRNNFNAWHVDIVAHSMGGLISRYYIHNFMPDPPDVTGKPVARRLMMIGTPNRGSPCADLLANLSLAVTHFPHLSMYELRTDVIGRFDRVVRNQKGVKFSILAGDVLPGFCGSLERGDVVVPRSSALADYADVAFSFDFWEGLHIRMTGSRVIFDNYVRPRLAEGPMLARMFAHVAKRRADDDEWSKSMSLLAAPLDQTVSSAAPQILASELPVLSPGETRQIAITVTQGAAFGVLVVADGMVRSRLSDPNGTPVDEVSPGTADAARGFRSVRVENPLNGVWQVELTNEGAQTSRLATSAWIEGSPLTIALQTGTSATDGRVPVSVTVQNSGSPVLGAQVRAVFSGTTGTSVTVPLFDDGLHGDGASSDGIYGALAGPLPTGGYVVSIEAVGTDFRRITTGEAEVVSGQPAVWSDLALTVSDTPDPVVVGQNLTYTLTVTNLGPESASGVTLIDTLPVGTTLVSASSSVGSCTPSAPPLTADQNITCAIGDLTALAPNNTATVTIISVPTSPGTLHNVASVTGNEGDPNGLNNSAASQTVVETATSPDLALTKSHTGIFTVGTEGTYSVTVANATSAGPTTGQITVTDTLPAGLRYVSGTGTGWSCPDVVLDLPGQAQVVTCTNPGPLAPGASSTLTLTVDVLAAAVPSVMNTATVATDDETNTANNSASDPTTVNLPAPDLSLTKSHAGGFIVGQNGIYTLAVANAANAGETTGPITVTDTLPNGLTYISGVGSGWTCQATGQDVTCTNDGPLAAGASSEITLTVGVESAAVPSVTNSATVSTAGETNTANNSASDPTTVSPRPADLSLTKTHTGDFTVGQNGVYTLTVTNAAAAGPTSGAITLIDTLPDGLTYLAATTDGWSCEASGQTVTCTNPGPLAPGASSVLSLAVTVGSAAAPSVTNAASVSTPGETNTQDNVASDPTTVRQTAPDLSLTKTHTGDFTVGQNGQYTLTVSNAAAAGATSGPITVTDTLPSGLTYSSASGSGWSCSVNGQTVTCTQQAALAAGASSSVELTVSVAAAAVPNVTNTASVETSGETNTANNSASDPTTVRALSPDLSLTKSHSGDFTVGAEGLYSLVVSNAAAAGPTTGAITVTDTLPSGLTFVPTTPGPSDPWSCSVQGQAATCTVTGPLQPGATVTIPITVSVAAAAVPSVTNRACVQTTGDANAANDCDDDPTTVKQSTAPPDLSLTKAHGGDFVVGTEGLYGLTVRNAATAGPTTGPITITDTLPAGLGFVSGTGAGWSCQASGQTVTCTNAGPIAPAASSAVTLTVGVGAAAAPSVTNTASVETTGETNTADNTASDPTTVVTGQTACTLYGADGAQGNPSRLYVLNPSNGTTVSTVGPIGFAITGLAVHPTTGVLYGSTSNASATSPGSLVRIDRTTGVGTLVGSFGYPGQTMGDLAFDRSGRLFGWLEGSDDDLYTIDLTSGAATLVGDSQLNTFGSGLAFSPGGTLYQAGEGDNGRLLTIDPSTGSVAASVQLNGTTGRAIAALTIDTNGTLFGARLQSGGGAATAELVTINPSSGAIDVRGQTVNRLDGIVFACQEPPTPDLSLTKTHTGNFTVGQNGTYTLTVANAPSAGPTTNSMTLIDTLPNGLSFVSGTGEGWTCQANGQQVSCTNPATLAPGGSSQIVLSVAVGAAAVPSVTNTALVSTSGETSTADNSATDLTIVEVPVVAPDLSITKTHTDGFTVGEHGHYTVTVSNAASAGPTAGAITVTDTLPAGLTYLPLLTILPPDWTCQVSDQTVTCTYAKTLAAGESTSFPLVVEVSSAVPASVTNTVSVSTPGETNTANNSASDLTTVAVATPTPTVTTTVTETPTPTSTATATMESTATSTATASITVTPLPTWTPTATATPTGTTAPTVTVTPTGTTPPTVTVTPTKTPTPTSTPAIPPSSGCELYPIALHVRAVSGISVGATIADNGGDDDLVRPRWLTWTGDRSAEALARSLTPPGDSHTYINPNNPNDHVVSAGDWVQGTSDRAVDGRVRSVLQALKGREIVVPIWDTRQPHGEGREIRPDSAQSGEGDSPESRSERGLPGRQEESGRNGQDLYRIVGFARIQILEYQLRGEDRLLIRYLGSAACTGGGPPPPPPSCELYPLGLHVSTVSGVQPGTVLRNVFEGTGAGQFGWLSWSGDGSAPALARSLTPPGDSRTYVNPYNPNDHIISVGDWVSGNTGVSDARQVRDALDRLLQREIVVPVWDMVGAERSGRHDDDGEAADREAGSGANSSGGGRTRFRVSNFARIRLLEYRLSGKGAISAMFLGFDPCAGKAGLRTTTHRATRVIPAGATIDEQQWVEVNPQPPDQSERRSQVMVFDYIWVAAPRTTRSSRPTRRRGRYGRRTRQWTRGRRKLSQPDGRLE